METFITIMFALFLLALSLLFIGLLMNIVILPLWALLTLADKNKALNEQAKSKASSAP